MPTMLIIINPCEVIMVPLYINYDYQLLLKKIYQSLKKCFENILLFKMNITCMPLFLLNKYKIYITTLGISFILDCLFHLGAISSTIAVQFLGLKNW